MKYTYVYKVSAYTVTINDACIFSCLTYMVLQNFLLESLIGYHFLHFLCKWNEHDLRWSALQEDRGKLCFNQPCCLFLCFFALSCVGKMSSKATAPFVALFRCETNRVASWVYEYNPSISVFASFCIAESLQLNRKHWLPSPSNPLSCMGVSVGNRFASCDMC